VKAQLLLLSFSFVLISCGGKNESGKPAFESNLELSPVEVQQEDREVKRDFMKAGRRLLNTYERELRRELGDEKLEFIKLNFRRENIEVTDLELTTGGAGRPQRSLNHGYHLVIYSGSRYPNLNWKNTLAKNDFETDYYVMHELLELGGINDSGMVYTKRILERQQRPIRRR
jgi:hypothetical protein